MAWESGMDSASPATVVILHLELRELGTGEYLRDREGGPGVATAWSGSLEWTQQVLQH